MSTSVSNVKIPSRSVLPAIFDCSNSGKFYSESLVLLKNFLRLGQTFKPDMKFDTGIKSLGQGIRWFGIPTSINYALRTIHTDPKKKPLEFTKNCLKTFDWTFHTVLWMGDDKVDLVNVPSIFNKLGVVAGFAKLGANGIDLYSGLDKLSKTKEKISDLEKEPDVEKADDKEVRLWKLNIQKQEKTLTILGIGKYALKILTGLAGIFLILYGKAVVSGTVLLALSTIATTFSIIRDIYKESGSMGAFAKQREQMAKQQIDIEEILKQNKSAAAA